MLDFYRYWMDWYVGQVPVARLFALPVLMFSWPAMVISGLIGVREDAFEAYAGVLGLAALLAVFPFVSYYPNGATGIGFYLGAAATVLFFVAYIVSRVSKKADRQ